MHVGVTDGSGSTVARYPHEIPVTDWLVGVVREKLAKRGSSRSFSVDDDLSEIGLSSLDMVNLMLRVEVEYDLQIPEAEMTAENFRSVAKISRLVTALLAQA
jgi:acyl carrier protein